MLSNLLNSSIALSIRYYSNQAYDAASHLLSEIERISVGCTRDFMRDPKQMIKKLTAEARTNQTGCSVVSLGYLGGNYAVVTPRSQAELVALVTHFDRDGLSRKGHSAFKFFSGQDFFILSDTGHAALTARKNLSRFLIPARLAHPMITEIEQSVAPDTEIQTRHTVCGIVRAVMLEHILGIKKLPDNTYDVMEAYRNDVKRWGAFPFPELLNFMPSLRRKRATYKAFSSDLIGLEFDKTVEILHSDENAGETNLLVASIVSLFRDENPDLSPDEFRLALKSLSTEEIRIYFETPFVQSLPMILKAADNLTDAIVLCLEQLALDPNMLELLRNELDESSLRLGDETELDIRELKSFPVLDAFYKESLRFDAPPAIPRYTTTGYRSETMDIPPHTMVILDLNALAKGKEYWDNPETFDPKRFLRPQQGIGDHAKHKAGEFPFVPFSVGLRNCPAFNVTETLFKVAIAQFVSNYTLTFTARTEEDSMIQMTARQAKAASSARA